MANLKTSQEADAGTLDGSEQVRIVQSGADKKTTTGAIAALSTGGFTVPYFSNLNDLGIGNNAGAANGGVNGNRYSTYFGTNAGVNDVGNSNAYFGYGAGLSATGSFNAAFGDASGPYDGGRNNACFGGWANTENDSNVAVGENAKRSAGAAWPSGRARAPRARPPSSSDRTRSITTSRAQRSSARTCSRRSAPARWS